MSFAPFAEGAIHLKNPRISERDAERQTRAARRLLSRLARQPGVILADEVGMGKTFVALAVAASILLDREDAGPVVVMTPPSLRDKWPKDWGYSSPIACRPIRIGCGPAPPIPALSSCGYWMTRSSGGRTSYSLRTER